MQEVINGFKKENCGIPGDYIGVDPEDPKDTCNLEERYIENENSSGTDISLCIKRCDNSRGVKPLL